jgi:hypothetical protein
MNAHQGRSENFPMLRPNRAGAAARDAAEMGSGANRNGRSLGGTARPSPHRFDGGERISKKVITRKEYVS